MALFYEFAKLNNEQINSIVNGFNEGKIVILPTETVYGLCCIATNTEAIKKIYKIKKRSFDKPLSVLVSNIDQVNNIAMLKTQAINDLKLGNTIILKTKTNNFSKAIYGNQDQNTIGIRMPNNCDILKFLSFINQPIVATSVNLSNEPPLIAINNLSDQILSYIDIVISGDQFCSGVPSSIIDYHLDSQGIKLR